jgi:drug/metabolite transporter (DMT)-like permease
VAVGSKHIVKENNILGIALMILNGLMISLIYVIIKALTKDVSSSLVAFLYKLLLLISILPWCFWSGGFANLKTQRLWLHAIKGVFSMSASLSLYVAFKYLKLTDIQAIGYLEQVILVVIGICCFSERATKAKIAGVVIAFLGAFVVIYPDVVSFTKGSFLPDFFVSGGFWEFNYYYTFVFVSVGFYAINSTVIKVLGKTDSAKAQMFYSLVFGCLMAFPLALMKWEPMSEGSIFKLPVSMLAVDELGLKYEHIIMLVFLSIFYFVHSIAFINSLKHAEMSVTMPFYYSNIVFGSILGYYLFDEVPESGSGIGYLLIVGAGLILLRSEARKRRKLKNSDIKNIQEKYDNA